MASGATVQTRRFRVLAGAYAVSSFGSQLNMVALNLFAYRWTGSPLGLGAIMITRLLAGGLSGPLTPRLIARTSYKQLQVWTNAVQALAMVLLACSPAAARTVVLVAVAVVAGSANTVFMVALRSAIPDMVGQERRTWANSQLVTGRSLAMVAGFASAGIVISLQGYRAAFLVDALTFVVCLLAVAPLHFPGRGAEPARPGTGPATLAAGSRATLLGATLILMIALRGVDALVSASHNAALPVYSTLLNPDHPAAFVSTFLTAWAVGNVAVQQVVQRLGRNGGRASDLTAFAVGTALMSGSFILGFAGLPFAVTMVVAFGAGCADGFTEVSYTSHLQSLPGALRDRAFGLSAAVENLGFGAGMAVSAVLLDVVSPFPVVAGSHGVAIAFVAFTLAFHRRNEADTTVRALGAGPLGDGEEVGPHVAPAHRDHRDCSAIPGS